jgi:DNA invertase Pin-like site-specific DNA recombinase
VLVVWKVDRVARSLSELLSILVRLKGVGASIKSLTEPIDTSTPIGEFTFQILGAVAQLERSMIRERVMAGQAAAKARGKKWGTRPAIAEEDEPALVAWFAQGGRTIPETALHFGVHQCVVRRVIGKQFPPSLYSRPGRPKKRV